MELPPFSASLGAMGSLAGKLDALLDTELKNEMGKLTTRLLKLSKAQDPPHTARNWMKDVRELSYEMQNCVDTETDWINTMSGFKARAKASNGRYDRYNLESIPTSTNIASGRGLPMVDVQRWPGPAVVGLPDGPFGRLCHLLADGDDRHKVLSIVGAGGIGKTTLAKELWRKHKQGDYFHCRAFVRTAKKPDIRRILRSILAQVRPHKPPDASEVDELIHDLTEHLKDKRYFLIIDDLWATSVWDVVRHAFPEGNHYSRIVTTTEMDDVALSCCTYQSKHIFKMEPLNFSHSKELFTSGVFGSGEEAYRQLDEASDEIVRRCSGLPLAIITIASALASQEEADAVEKRDQIRKRWRWLHNFVYLIISLFIQTYHLINPMQPGRQKNSTIGGCLQHVLLKNLPSTTTSCEKMKQVLNLCYNSLPICLQTCLLYLSLYPENYIILKEDIMKQWVAEGFIRAPTEKDIMKVAGNYFDRLVSMGLIQHIDVDYSDEVLYYVVHHMVHDLITSKTIEENFITVMDYSQRTIRFSNKVGRLSLQFGSATHATSPANTGLSQVRSLAFIGLLTCFPSILEFKLLRLLILHIWCDQARTGFNLRIISEFCLLRYLQVTCNDTVHLPDQMQVLKHLQTFEINGKIQAIPSDIFLLQNLLHLRLGGGTDLPDVTGIVKIVTLNAPPSASGRVFSLDDSSSPPDLVQTMELLPPIWRMPEWVGQLSKLRILKIVVGELQMNDISNLQGLPALNVLSLYVLRRTSAEPISFINGAFAALEYFEFTCGVLCLAFEEGAMPILQRIKVGFNAHRGEQYDGSLHGIQDMLSVQKISVLIGSAVGANESDMKAAQSAVKKALGKNHTNASIKRADMVEEEFDPPEENHSIRREHESTSSEQTASGTPESKQNIKKKGDTNSELIKRTSNQKEHTTVEPRNEPRPEQGLHALTVNSTSERFSSLPGPSSARGPLDVVIVYAFDCSTWTSAWYAVDDGVFWMVQEKLAKFTDSCMGYIYAMLSGNTYTCDMKIVDPAETRATGYTGFARRRVTCSKNMASGLSEAHKMISNRGYDNGIILLFSDGLENKGDFFDGAEDFRSKVPVHTFTFDGDAYNHVLHSIAENSPGGKFHTNPVPERPLLSIAFSKLLDNIFGGCPKDDEKPPSPISGRGPLDVVMVYAFDCTDSTSAWHTVDNGVFWLLQEKLTHFPDSCMGYVYVMSSPNTYTSDMKLVDSAETRETGYTGFARRKMDCTKNMASGLPEAHKMIRSRGIRNGIILFFSDGLVNKGDFFDGTENFRSKVPVHTFTLGGDAYNQGLRDIAAKSPGGTFNPLPVPERPQLSAPFSKLLDRLLSGTMKD